jgi:hypothetical protein
MSVIIRRIGLKKLLLFGGLLCDLGFGGYFVLTAPFTWAALHPTRDVADNGPPNLTNGQSLFYAGRSAATKFRLPSRAAHLPEGIIRET